MNAADFYSAVSRFHFHKKMRFRNNTTLTPAVEYQIYSDIYQTS